MFAVYIIAYRVVKRKLRYYTGYTNNLSTRFAQHKSGKGAKCLKGVKIEGVAVVYKSMSQKDAMQKERDIKGLSKVEKRDLYRSNDAIDQHDITIYI